MIVWTDVDLYFQHVNLDLSQSLPKVLSSLARDYSLRPEFRATKETECFCLLDSRLPNIPPIHDNG